MSSREDILARLRKNTRNTYDKPEVNIHGIQYDDPVAQFIHVATTAGGARLMELKEGDDLNAKIETLRKALGGLHEEILAAMADLRVVVDSIEKNVSDECWPLPKYREMLFVY